MLLFLAHGLFPPSSMGDTWLVWILYRRRLRLFFCSSLAAGIRIDFVIILCVLSLRLPSFRLETVGAGTGSNVCKVGGLPHNVVCNKLRYVAFVSPVICC